MKAKTLSEVQTEVNDIVISHGHNNYIKHTFLINIGNLFENYREIIIVHFH
jgi:hypothetical protein